MLDALVKAQELLDRRNKLFLEDDRIVTLELELLKAITIYIYILLILNIPIINLIQKKLKIEILIENMYVLGLIGQMEPLWLPQFGLISPVNIGNNCFI